MIIISLSQDLEGNPNLVVIDCINHLATFFSCQPTGKVPAPVKATHHLSKAFQHGQPPHLWKKIPWLCGGVKASDCMFEGGNFVKSKSDTCDQYPLKTLQPHKLRGSATEPSLPTSIRFIYYFVFEETVCNLHLPTTICILCVHKKKQTWPSLPEICYSIVSAWS